MVSIRIHDLTKKGGGDQFLAFTKQAQSSFWTRLIQTKQIKLTETVFFFLSPLAGL